MSDRTCCEFRCKPGEVCCSDPDVQLLSGGGRGDQRSRSSDRDLDAFRKTEPGAEVPAGSTYRRPRSERPGVAGA